MNATNLMVIHHTNDGVKVQPKAGCSFLFYDKPVNGNIFYSKTNDQWEINTGDRLTENPTNAFMDFFGMLVVKTDDNSYRFKLTELI